MKTLTIVGGAVIGLSCALYAAENGWEVTVYEADETSAASRVAAGMLGIAGESRTGEETYLAFAEQAMSRWPAFLERLGDDRIVAASSSLMVGVDSADVGELAMVADWLRDRGHPVEPLTGKDIRALEPAVSARIRSGFCASGELAVDNRRLLQVLSDRATEAGVQIVRKQVADLADVPGDQVLLAAGVGSAMLWPDLGVYPSRARSCGWAGQRERCRHPDMLSGAVSTDGPSTSCPALTGSWWGPRSTTAATIGCPARAGSLICSTTPSNSCRLCGSTGCCRRKRVCARRPRTACPSSAGSTTARWWPPVTAATASS